MNGPFDAIVVERTDVEELIDAAQAAIDGDSNDAEHDALVSILHYLISIAALGPLDFDEKGSPDIPKVVKIAYAMTLSHPPIGCPRDGQVFVVGKYADEWPGVDVAHRRTPVVCMLCHVEYGALKEEER